LFEECVERNPDSLALVFQERQLSYAELNTRANQLAHHLRKLGVQAEMRVAICVDRSLEMVIGILGVLKAGGAYVPIDPAYPKERISFVLDDINSSVLLTQERHLKMLPKNKLQSICLDSGWAEVQGESFENLSDEAIAENLAYVIYTSGSTGKPKGVQITHRNLVHSTCARFAYYHRAVSSFLLLSSFSFDSSIAGIFWTLCQGGTLILPQESLYWNLSELAGLIKRHHVSHLLCLPALLKLLLSEGKLQTTRALNTVIVAGEVCLRELVERHYKMLPETSLFNEYGPTECTVWSTVYLTGTTDLRRHVPIGRPVANMQAYILDRSLRPVTIWQTGELHIGGDGLARGYLNRPDDTAEKFIPHPFSKEPGTRLYKTGDLARHLPDGCIEFLGRLDHQVKIRGHRIELDEIETVLRQHPGVQEGVVLAREDSHGDLRLIAYLVAGRDSHSPPTHAELTSFLGERLPEHMMPSALTWLDAIPLMPNGKIDRLALLKLDLARSRGKEVYVAARNPAEATLVKIWKEVLGVEQVGVHDDFFDLGGHSLLATQLMSRVDDAMQVQLPVRKLFESPTIARLAEAIAAITSDKDEAQESWEENVLPEMVDNRKSSAELAETELILEQYPVLLEAVNLARGGLSVESRSAVESAVESSLVEIQSSGSKRPFFCIHPGGGSVGCYYYLARHLGPDQPFYGLQAVGLDGKGVPYTSIEDMAAHYINVLRLVQPEGPYLLGAWSSGGLVAFEMAQQLHAHDQKVSLLALIDTVLLFDENGSEIEDAMLLVELFADTLPLSLDYLRSLEPDEQLIYVSEQLKVSELVPEAFGLYWFRAYFNVYKNFYRAALKYTPRFYPDYITLFRANEATPHNGSDLDLGWRNLAAGVEIKLVEGNHGNMVKEPYVKHLAEQLRASLAAKGS
jgi:amino acid adenylation domain-containing protein